LSSTWLQVSEGNSLFEGQSREDICTDYLASNSTAHVHCSSLHRLNTDKETAGLVLASRPCHDGTLSLLLEERIPTSDRMLIHDRWLRLLVCSSSRSRKYHARPCLAVENGAQPLHHEKYGLGLLAKHPYTLDSQTLLDRATLWLTVVMCA
jgi:hypothetical protein